jgi:hypothetical protein
MEVPSAYHLNAQRKKTRTGHTFRGNQLCVITRHHTITLNMVNGLFLRFYILDMIQEKKEWKEMLYKNKTNKEGITY